MSPRRKGRSRVEPGNDANETELARIRILELEAQKRQEQREDERVRRQEEQEQERARREHELAVRKAEIERELELERIKAGNNSNPVNDSGNNSNMNIPKVEIPKLHPHDNIDSYLKCFERLAMENKWDADMWVSMLAPKLTGKARDAYTNFPDVGHIQYDDLKKAILNKYELTAEAYRRKFFGCMLEEQSFKEWGGKLIYYLDKWVELAGKDKTNAQDLMDLIIMDQMYRKMPVPLTQYLKEKEPTDCAQLMELADKYVDLKGGRKWLTNITKHDHPDKSNERQQGGKYNKQNL